MNPDIDVLIERGHAESLPVLERHWRGPRTLAFVDEKSLAAAPWLNHIEKQLP